MSAFAIAKAGVHIVAALGVTRVVAQVIQNNTVAVTAVDKVLINTGGFVLGSIIVDHASDRVNYAFEKFEAWSQERKEEVEAAAAEEKSKNGNSKSSN